MLVWALACVDDAATCCSCCCSTGVAVGVDEVVVDEMAVCAGKTGAIATGFAGFAGLARVIGVKIVAFITTGRMVVVITG